MRRRGVALATTALVVGSTLTALAAPGTSTPVLTAGGVTAEVTATGARLTDGLVTRQWAIAAGQVTTVGLRDDDGANWAAPGPDFSLGLGGVPTSSISGW